MVAKASIKDLVSYLNLKDFSCYINKVYIPGLKSLSVSDSKYYVVNIAFTPSAENLKLLGEKILGVKLLLGKKVVFEKELDVMDIGLAISDDGVVLWIEAITCGSWEDDDEDEKDNDK